MRPLSQILSYIGRSRDSRRLYCSQRHASFDKHYLRNRLVNSDFEKELESREGGAAVDIDRSMVSGATKCCLKAANAGVSTERKIEKIHVLHLVDQNFADSRECAFWPFEIEGG